MHICCQGGLRRLAMLVTMLLVAAVASAATTATTIRIASWNLEDFGYGKSRCKDLGAVATLIAPYDVIALQECMRFASTAGPCYGDCSGDLCHLDLLVSRLNAATNHTWQYVTSGYMHRGTRYEYLVFLYQDTVQVIGSPGSASTFSQLGGTCAGSGVTLATDSPVFASFRSGSFDFTLINIHSPTDATATYNRSAGSLYDCVQLADPREQDIVLLGDFNSSASALGSGAGVHLVCLSASGSTNDWILLDDRYTSREFAGTSGVVKSADVTSVSNHPIVWADFSTGLADDD